MECENRCYAMCKYVEENRDRMCVLALSAVVSDSRYGRPPRIEHESEHHSGHSHHDKHEEKRRDDKHKKENPENPRGDPKSNRGGGSLFGGQSPMTGGQNSGFNLGGQSGGQPFSLG